MYGCQGARKVRRGRQTGHREYQDEKWHVYGDEKSLHYNPPSPYSYRQLLKLARSPVLGARRASANYLYAFLTSASAGHLASFLRDPDPKVRYYAAISLGRYGVAKGRLRRNAVNALINVFMNEPDSSARKEMEGALGRSGDPKAVSALRRALRRYPKDQISIEQSLEEAERLSCGRREL